MRIRSLTQKQISTYEERNAKIFDLYTNHNMTMEAIGEKFGITKARVWQIVTRCLEGQGDYYAFHRRRYECQKKLHSGNS